MGANLITTEELLKLKEAEEQQKKYFTTEELMNMSIMSSAPKQDIQSQMTTPNTPESVQVPVQKQESKIKDIWDSFKLGASGLIHDAKQFFTGTVPNYIFQDIKDSDRRYIENKFGLPEGTVTDELMHNVDKKHELIRENAQIKYDKAEENYQKWLEDHPELQPREEWSKGVLETIKENPAILLDPAYWGYVAAQSAAFSIGIMGTTVLATALTGNPLIGMAAGTAIAYPSQAHDLYKDLIESGATKEQAAELSVPLGAAIASVETIGDLPILGAISKPFKQMLTKNIKKEVVQSVFKSGIKTFLAAEASEVLEEIVQGAIQDATVKTFDENRDMLENIPETVIQTLIATAPMALFGGASQMRNTQNYNQILETESKKVQVIQEALDKLTGTEKDVDIIKGIESKLTEKGLEFGEKDYTNIKQQIEEKRPTDRPETTPSSPDIKQPVPGKVSNKPLVSLTEEQTEKINRIIPTNQNISKGNLELDKRKLKTPIKEIVSQYVPDPEQAKIVENNINRQVNNVIPRAEVKAPEMKLVQQEIKEIIQDEINNEIEIYHFSPKKVDVVDPFFMGENLTQAEKDRQENDPVSEKTSAFYTRESMPEEQFVAGPSLYKTKIDKDKLLDIRLPDNSKYITEQGNINETRIKEDGYMGYIAPIDRKAQVKLFEATPVQEMGIVQGSVKEGDALKPMWNIKSKIEPKAPDINIPKKATEERQKRQQEEQGQVVQQEEQGQVVQQEEQGQVVQQEEQGQKTQTAQKQEIDFEDTSQSGETGTHRLAERVYLGAIANEIETGLSTEELQQYNKTDMLDNAERAIAYVNKNYDEAVDILLNGGEAYDSQGHILKGGIFAAVKNIATLSGDKSLIIQLATNSHVSRESRFMGAYIKSFDEMGQYDAVVAIKKLHEYKTREAQKRIKNYDKKKQTEINKIDSFMGFDIEKLKKRLRDVFGNKDIYC